MRRVGKISMAVAAASLVLAGCATEDDEPTTGSGDGDESASESEASEDVCAAADGDGPKIGVAYDVGGRGDLSFNDSAFEGVKQAVEDLDATCREIEAGTGESDADREERLRLLADAGFNPIIAVGFIYSPAAVTVSSEYPDVNFAVVDGFATFITGEEKVIPNVTDLNFAENEGSFLVGAAAALKTESKTVGFVGGVNGPLIQKFEAGFKAGVEAVDPEVEILTEYLSQEDPAQGFENPAGGETAATGMFENGADVVYHAAGKSGLGVFDAVVAAGEGNWAIGVDSDQYLTADPEQQPYILTSMLKRIDNAVLEYVTAFDEGGAEGGVALYDLKVDGVGYATSNEEAISDIQGEIEVPATVE